MYLINCEQFPWLYIIIVFIVYIARIYHSLFKQLPRDRHLGHFQYFAIISNPCTSIFAYMPKLLDGWNQDWGMWQMRDEGQRGGELINLVLSKV